MGTNYYLPTMSCENACDHCSESQLIHVCKSLVMFQAHLPDPDGYWPDPPYPASSWQDWKRNILAASEIGLLVEDEYHQQFQAHEFIELVEATTPENRRRQHDWIRDHPIRGMSQAERMRDDWLDADGFSMCSRSFE